MTAQDFVQFCQELEGALVDQPFTGDFQTTVARHEKNRKWFAILMNKDGVDFTNLKCRPVEGAMLRSMFSGVRPAYHMNKEHWISVILQSDVPDDFIKGLVKASHALTKPAFKKQKPHTE